MDKHKMIATKTNDINIQYKDKNILLQGKRNPSDGLYDVNISTNKNSTSFNVETLSLNKLSTILQPYIKENH